MLVETIVSDTLYKISNIDYPAHLLTLGTYNASLLRSTVFSREDTQETDQLWQLLNLTGTNGETVYLIRSHDLGGKYLMQQIVECAASDGSCSAEQLYVADIYSKESYWSLSPEPLYGPAAFDLLDYSTDYWSCLHTSDDRQPFFDYCKPTQTGSKWALYPNSTINNSSFSKLPNYVWPITPYITDPATLAAASPTSASSYYDFTSTSYYEPTYTPYYGPTSYDYYQPHHHLEPIVVGLICIGCIAFVLLVLAYPLGRWWRRRSARQGETSLLAMARIDGSSRLMDDVMADATPRPGDEPLPPYTRHA